MKKLTAFLVLAVTLVALSVTAFAWGPKIDERPESFRAGKNRGYFIWRDQNAFHLWTTTRGQRHVFTGTITTDGDRFEVRPQSLEGGQLSNVFSKSRNDKKDSIKLDQDRDTIRFRFDNSGGGIDGIDFRVFGGNKVVFDLYIDGNRIDPSEIFIGEDGWHPGRSIFTLYR